MIEQKLLAATNRLPHQTSDYLSVEEKWKQQDPLPRRSRIRHKRIVFLVILALLLVGCVAAAAEPDYHLYNGSWAGLFYDPGLQYLADELGMTFSSAQSKAEDLGWTLPDTLGGLPFTDFDKFNLTTQESSYWKALLSYDYQYYGARYETEVTTMETNPDGTVHPRTSTDNLVNLTFGSMENEVWRRQFHYDENDVWVGVASSHCILVNEQIIDYRGFTVYLSEYFLEGTEMTVYYVSWIDHVHSTVFQIHTYEEYSPDADFGISCAKELIDLNAE